MRIWLYAIIRNEEKILPYFLRHYAPWVTKFVFYDDLSDDGTRDIIKSCPAAEIRDWPGSGGINDDQFMDFANEQWKEARGHADYVVWVDADEFLYHPAIKEVLSRYLAEDVDVPQIQGFLMVSKSFPTTKGQIYDEVRTGLREGQWDKKAIFRKNMLYGIGRHEIDFSKFALKSSEHAEIKLLHYRALGMEYVRWRHNRNWCRLPERCRRIGFGPNVNPDYVGHHSVAWFDEVIGKDWPEVI